MSLAGRLVLSDPDGTLGEVESAAAAAIAALEADRRPAVQPIGCRADDRDYLDLEETPEAVASTTATLAENAAHLARALRADPYPSS